MRQVPFLTIRVTQLAILTTIVLALPAFSSTSMAAEIPEKYRGVWGVLGCELPDSESDVGEFPYLIIDAKEFHSHETTCQVISVAPAKSRDKVSFKCFGEGEEWPMEEEWTVRNRTIDIWGWTITQQTLVTRSVDFERVYKKCPLSAVRREREE
jgi:hypothetical protein